MLHKPNLKHVLVAFKICPWCMRVLTMMHQKGLDFEVKFIELSNKPDWFDSMSPLQKVPILIIGESVVIFESNVIMEYMDEMVKPSLLPQDPIEKALDRGRFEYANEIIKTIYQFAFACNQEKFMKAKIELCKYCEKVESWLGNTKFFHGNEISLIDICLVPVFVSLCSLSKVIPCDFLKKYPKMIEYAKNLTSIPAVKKGRVPDFESLLLNGVRQNNAFLYQANPGLFPDK